jgi:hypothetical protein
MDRPVAKAREPLTENWRHAWPAPLVYWLREQSFDLALDWVLPCTRQLLPRAGTPHEAELLEELSVLNRWRADPPPSAVFRAKTEELWYRAHRDDARTAISRLCWDLACVLCQDLTVGINWLWPVLSLLTGHGSPQIELVDSCIADFEKFAASIGKSPG